MMLPRFVGPALLASFLLAGCASDATPRSQAGKEAARQAPLPTLAGREAFFDGKIVAELKVGVLTGFDHRGDGSAKGDGGPGAGGGYRRRGGMGGGGGGGFGLGGGMGPGPGGGRDGAEGGSDDPERSKAMQTRRAERMGSPPVMIHLRFTNTGSERVDLTIADFLSPLGNFVTFPSKLTLEPGQSAEVEPMTSRLAGEITGGEITLNLRAGSRQESRTVALEPETSPAGPAPKS